MKNYAEFWKKTSRFKEIPYHTFINNYGNSKDIWFSQKVDGILAALVYKKDEDCYLITVNGIITRNIPLVEEYKNILQEYDSAIIIGDLVAIKGKKILPFNQIVGIVRTAYKNKNYSKMVHHYIYDIMSLNGKKPSYNQTLNYLNFLTKNRNYIHLPIHIKGGIEEFRKLWDKTKDLEGYDGIIARLSNGRTFKIKYTYTVDLVVIGSGHINMKAWEKGQISYLITAFMDEDGLFRRSSKVGTGFTNKLRSELYDYIQKNKIDEINGELFIKPEKIIEVEYKEPFIRKTTCYKFNWNKNKIEVIGDKKSVVLRQPSFKRFRPDKKIEPDNLRLEQIPEFG